MFWGSGFQGWRFGVPISCMNQRRGWWFQVKCVGCCGWGCFQGPQKHISINILYRDIPTLLGLIIRGFRRDIPILSFAYVPFLGPYACVYLIVARPPGALVAT